jgi:signal peptidase
MIQSFIQSAKDQWNELVNLNKRQALTQAVNLGAGSWVQGSSCLQLRQQRAHWTCLLAGLVVTSALIIWKSLMLITGSESPVGAAAAAKQQPTLPAQLFPLRQALAPGVQLVLIT